MTVETKLKRNNNLPKCSALPINDKKPFFFPEGNACVEVYRVLFFLGPYRLNLFLYSDTIFSLRRIVCLLLFTLCCPSFPSHPLPSLLLLLLSVLARKFPSSLFPSFSTSILILFPFSSSVMWFPFLSLSFLFFICILLHSYSSLWRVITSCLSQL